MNYESRHETLASIPNEEARGWKRITLASLSISDYRFNHEMQDDAHYLTVTLPGFSSQGTVGTPLNGVDAQGRLERGSDVVGLLHWYGDTGAIAHVEVDPNHQRQGLATEMFRRAKDIDPNLQLKGDWSNDGLGWANSMKTVEQYDPKKHPEDWHARYADAYAMAGSLLYDGDKEPKGDIEAMYLVGSRAKGTAREDSDYDWLVVGSDFDKQFRWGHKDEFDNDFLFTNQHPKPEDRAIRFFPNNHEWFSPEYKSVTAAQSIKPEHVKALEQQMGEIAHHYGWQDEPTPYEDRSKIVHTFDNGWTIRKPQFNGDAFREGQLMSNCLSDFFEQEQEDESGKVIPIGDGHDWNKFFSSNPELHPNQSANYYSLRDPNNIPHVTFNIDDYESGFISGILGRHNAPPKDSYKNMVLDFAHKYLGQWFDNFEEYDDVVGNEPGDLVANHTQDRKCCGQSKVAAESTPEEHEDDNDNLDPEEQAEMAQQQEQMKALQKSNVFNHMVNVHKVDPELAAEVFFQSTVLLGQEHEREHQEGLITNHLPETLIVAKKVTNPLSLAYKPGKLWYRVHYAPRAWDADKPISITGLDEGRYDAKGQPSKRKEIEVRKGYSAYDNPFDLDRYWGLSSRRPTFDERRLDSRKHYIAVFEGQQIGWGYDEEPLVKPNDKPMITMSLEVFRKSLVQTPTPKAKYHWHVQEEDYSDDDYGRSIESGWYKGSGKNCSLISMRKCQCTKNKEPGYPSVGHTECHDGQIPVLRDPNNPFSKKRFEKNKIAASREFLPKYKVACSCGSTQFRRVIDPLRTYARGGHDAYDYECRNCLKLASEDDYEMVRLSDISPHLIHTRKECEALGTCAPEGSRWDEMLDEMRDGIQHDPIEPITLISDESGNIIDVEDGAHRIGGAYELGLTTIPAKVIKRLTASDKSELSYRMFCGGDAHGLYTLDKDNTIVGHIMWWDDRNNGYSDDDDAHVVRLETHPDYQRRGIATGLWNMAREHTPHLLHSRDTSPAADGWISSLPANQQGRTDSALVEATDILGIDWTSPVGTKYKPSRGEYDPKEDKWSCASKQVTASSDDWDWKSPNHDYDPAWDYEMDENPHPDVVDAVEVHRPTLEAAARHAGLARPQIHFIKAPKDRNVVAIYANGTKEYPVLMIDANSHLDSHSIMQSEVGISLLHELGHAIQDTNLDGDVDDFHHDPELEDSAEDYARNVFSLGHEKAHDILMDDIGYYRDMYGFEEEDDD